jgi:hypothetical protein
VANKWRAFTPEEASILSESLWVKKVTSKMVIFTDDFKEEFLRQHCQGKTSREIITGLGFDAEMLGRSRIEGIQLLVKDYALKNKLNLETSNAAEPLVSGASMTTQLKRMQHKLSYMEQQIEFIKKTILADRKARQS